MEQKYNNFKKHFGQNFIRDFEAINKAIQALDIQPDDIVIEIGPGDGKVTEHLVQKCQGLILIEIDNELVARLRDKFTDAQNLNIINKSVLDVDFDEVVGPGKKYKVIGSLPYNISKKIIKKLIETENRPQRMSFIVQKEVARSYSAIIPDATFLANFSSIYYDVKYIGTVKKEKFVPRPQVDGGIIQFTLKQKPEVNPEDYEKFTKFLFNCFRQPRKKLKNVLKSIYIGTDWEEAFQKLKIDSSSRAANLKLTDFINLHKSLTP